jgi:hypothetical protein
LVPGIACRVFNRAVTAYFVRFGLVLPPGCANAMNQS